MAQDDKPTIISLDQLQREEKPEKEFTTPEIEGEESVSGSTPAPESDDDTLQNAHDVGLQRGETYDNAESLSIDRDIDTNEKHKQNH